MKNQLKEKMLQCLNDRNIKEIIDCEEFYFQKAVNKYDEVMKLPKLGEEITKKLIDKVNKLRNENNFNYLNFLKDQGENSEEYKILLCLGEFIAYIDFQAANKNEFNQYSDKRTIARSYVRQNEWIVNLLKYKQNEDLEELTPAIKNAMKFLLNPAQNINILSEKHRQLIGMMLFENPSMVDRFYEFIQEEMMELNIKVKNEINRSIVYERIIYNDSVRALWQTSKTIWKISHGNISQFDADTRENYMKKRIVVVHEDTGRNQGSNFKNKVKIGDLFYLCFGGSEIKLLGIITSDAVSLEGQNEGWLMRSYDVIKESINHNRYTGVSLGWTPNYNSTIMAVKEEQFLVFQKELLEPYFGIKMDELINSTVLKEVNGFHSEENDEQEDENVNENSYFHELNYILYGPPGTGKTYNSINYAVAIIERKTPEVVQAEDYTSVKSRFDKYKNEGEILFTTFHQSYGYEEFIEGIKPLMNKENKDGISYCIESGVFKQICSRALQNKNKNYVLIIDEINRGNISKIFGELITLIEKTKRIGALEETKTTLPYSKSEFGVPKNVYLFGTMNTADRSIALLDTALRRRFEFIEMMPDSEVLLKLNKNRELMVENINIKKMIDVMNKRIEILYDREHTIGQAYFIDLVKDNNIDTLSDIFTLKILPLLQEYFYDDYEKIRMVLADNQVNEEELQFINLSSVPADLFGNVAGIDFIEDKKVYNVNKSSFSNPESYVKIYNANYGAEKND